MADANASDSTPVMPVYVGTARIGHVFQAAGGFFFLLDDCRDLPRGAFTTADDAEHAAINQCRCLHMAERWELMLDT